MHEQQFALQDDWNGEVMYQKLCHVAKIDDKPVESNAKCETQDINALFGKKNGFYFGVSLVEKAIQSNNNVWNPWIGNGNSGLHAVSQANGIDETQLSEGHRKQQKKRIWMVERISNLRREMEENTQLIESGL